MGWWSLPEKIGEKLGIKFLSKDAEKAAIKFSEKGFWHSTLHGIPISSGLKFVEKGAGEAGLKIITKARVFYALLAVGLGYFFLSGGLPSLFSRITGLPIWVSQLIIAALLVFIALSFVQYIYGRAKRALRPFGGGGGGGRSGGNNYNRRY